MIGGRVLDTSALADAATGKTIYARALIRTAVEHGIVLAVPTAALMAAWASVPAGDQPFLAMLLDLPVTVVDVLDAPAARAAGLLAGSADGPPADLVAAHVAHCAARRHWPVVTADPGPVRAVDPRVTVELLP